MDQFSNNASPPRVVKIYTCPHQGQSMVAQSEVTIVKDKGIMGDRYFLDHFDGFYNNSGGILNGERAITLITIEGIEEGNRALQEAGGTPMRPEETRRNLLVSVGLHVLNTLVGHEFAVGEVRMRGVRFCGPCKRPPTLAGRPQDGSAFATAFRHARAIRAVPLTSGCIREGDLIVLPKVPL